MERRPPIRGGPSKALNADVLDDTTLMTLVTFLYAFIQFMTHYNLDPCSC